MSLQKLVQISSVLTVFAALGSATADTPAVTRPPSPLSQARTISVHEDVLMTGSGGTPQPFFHNTVLIRRPDKIKVVLAQAAPGKKPHLYVADGKTEREYNALTNQYSVVTPAPGGGSRSQLRDICRINLILNAGHLPPPRPGVQRTVTADTLDGQAMVLTTDTPTPKRQADGTEYSYPTKVWVSAATGLPRRWMLFMTKNGVTTPFQEVDFSGWVLNRPIPATRLAWAPPAGAKPYTEPVLLAVGTPAPDFTAYAPDGTPVHLSDYKGKPVVLDFWATWCGPCQQSMPHLERVYQQIKDKGVVVLGVCVWDQKDAFDKWVPTNIGSKYHFPVAFDPTGRGAKNIAGGLYKVTGIPTQYVIDKDGRVAATSVGFDGDDDHRLEASLSKLGVDVAPVRKTASAR